MEEKEKQSLPEISIEQLEEGVQHVNNPIIGLKPIEKRYLQTVKEYKQVNNSFYFTDGESTVEVMVLSDEIIRVRMAQFSAFSPEAGFLLIFLTEVKIRSIGVVKKDSVSRCILQTDRR